MYSTQSNFGDVSVQLDYEYDKATDSASVEHVWVGNIDIASGLSDEQMDKFEAVCYWADRDDSDDYFKDR